MGPSLWHIQCLVWGWGCAHCATLHPSHEEEMSLLYPSHRGVEQGLAIGAEQQGLGLQEGMGDTGPGTGRPTAQLQLQQRHLPGR